MSELSSTYTRWRVSALYADGSQYNSTPMGGKDEAMAIAVEALKDPTCVSAQVVRMAITESLEAL